MSTCPNEAKSLSRKQTEMRPPPTREDLHEIIMAKKKGRLEKLLTVPK
jgi:hypothetical protein